jgi:retron-type reverse transcriptase
MYLCTQVIYVTPIYKGKGLKSSPDNYRPISVLTPISKIFETLVAAQLKSYLEANELLSEYQFGFRVSRSCELALNTMIEDWRSALDIKEHLFAVFLDLSKAFDTVNHELLLKKLSFFNLDTSVVALVANYLHNRRIKVKVNGMLSKEVKKDSLGIPQGSILGPLLFILYINDLPKLKIKSKLMLFADDTTIYLREPNIRDVLADLEADLKLILEWLNHNRLILNVAKTQAMHVPFSRNDLELFKGLTLSCGPENIQFAACVRVLVLFI